MQAIGGSMGGGTSLFQIASCRHVLEEGCQEDKGTSLGLAKTTFRATNIRVPALLNFRADPTVDIDSRTTLL